MPKKWKIVYTQTETAHGQTKFWHAYAHEEELFDDITDDTILSGIENTLNAFASHEYNEGSRVKDLTNSLAKTMRINREHRLVFSTIEIHGLQVALIHGYVLKHAFKHQILFENRHVQHYEAACRESLELCVGEQKMESAAILPPPHSFPRERISQNECIELTPEQCRAIDSSYPLMVSGAGGVGKTTALAERMEKILAEVSLDQPIYILCITSTGRLAADIDEGIRDVPMSAHHTARAITYENWIRLFAEDRTLVDDTYFEAWYQDYVAKQKRVSRSAKSSAVSKSKTAEQAYPFTNNQFDMNAMKHTFMCFAGRNPAEVSLNNILFPLAMKPQVIAAYEAFLTDLEISRLLHPAFFVIPERFARENVCDFMYVDEGQNFTLLQIKNMFCHVKEIHYNQRAFHINYDSHQALVSHACNREDILHLMVPDASQIPQRHQILDGIQRSHPHIIDFVNQFVGHVKYPVTQGLGDRYEDSVLIASDRLKEIDLSACREPQLSVSSEAQQHVFWKSDKQDLSEYNFQSGRWLIITHPEFLREASLLYGNACTFEQSIGLEAENICIHRPFDHPAFDEINELLRDVSSEESRPHAQAKKDRGNKKFIPNLNAIVLAMLRAKRILLMIQDKTKRIQRILTRLGIEQYRDNAPAIIDRSSISDTELRRKIRAFILNKQDEMAATEYALLNAEARLGLCFTDFKASLQQTGTPLLLPLQTQSTPPNHKKKKCARAVPAASIQPVIHLKASSVSLKDKMNQLAEQFTLECLQELCVMDSSMRFLITNIPCPEKSRASLAASLGSVSVIEKTFLIDLILMDKENAALFYSFLNKEAHYLSLLVDNIDEYGQSPIHYAVDHSAYKLLRLLFSTGKKFDLEARYLCSTTLLSRAVLRKSKNITRFLIEMGASLETLTVNPVISCKGYTPLNFACLYGGTVDCAKILIEKGACLNQSANQPVAPLSVAIEFMNLAVLECLLSAGAELDFSDPSEGDKQYRAEDYARNVVTRVLASMKNEAKISYKLIITERVNRVKITNTVMPEVKLESLSLLQQHEEKKEASRYSIEESLSFMLLAPPPKHDVAQSSQELIEDEKQNTQGRGTSLN